MSKIVQAINSMILNSANISSVIEGVTSGEYFFLYKDYKWSIRKDADEVYWLFYYPNDVPDIDSLAAIDGEDWKFVQLLSYPSKEINTKEARASYAELYGVVKGRLFGVDDILDDIISDMPF